MMSRRREGGIMFETVDDDDVKRFLVSKVCLVCFCIAFEHRA